MSPDLWGQLPVPEKIKTPYTILLEQAQILRDKTNGILIGSVKRGNPLITGFSMGREREELAKEYFTVFFSVNSEIIPNYTYTILIIRHPVQIYPLTVKDEVNDIAYECKTESDLIDALGITLSSNKVMAVLGGLISLSNSET